MWAIYNESRGGIAYLDESTQFLIFHSKAEAWDCLLNKIKPDNISDFDVIEIRWTKA